MAEGLVLHEQRQLARRELIYYLKISDRRTGRELGRLGDLHGQGLLLLSPGPLTAGTVYEVDLELPKALQQERGVREIALRGEIAWSRPGPKNNTYHESGMRLLAVDAAQGRLIRQLIDLFAMPAA